MRRLTGCCFSGLLDRDRDDDVGRSGDCDLAATGETGETGESGLVRRVAGLAGAEGFSAAGLGFGASAGDLICSSALALLCNAAGFATLGGFFLPFSFAASLVDSCSYLPTKSLMLRRRVSSNMLCGRALVPKYGFVGDADLFDVAGDEGD